MDAEFGIDLEEMGRVIDAADVLLIRFHVLPQRLLLDMRTAGGHPPLVQLVQPVGSPEERYRFLERVRPGLPPPEDITVLVWPRYFSVMRQAGLWQRIVDRAVALGGPALEPILAHVSHEAEATERREIQSAIRGGEGYESLWERRPA